MEVRDERRGLAGLSNPVRVKNADRRIYLDSRINGRMMGEEITADGRLDIVIEIATTYGRPIAREPGGWGNRMEQPDLGPFGRMTRHLQLAHAELDGRIQARYGLRPPANHPQK